MIGLHLRRVIGNLVENENEGTKQVTERVCRHLLQIQMGYDSSLMPSNRSVAEEESSSTRIFKIQSMTKLRVWYKK